MTPERLRSLVRNFTSLSKEETQALRLLAGDAPYSQVIHMLMARSSKEQGAPDQQAQLNRAAVYATDRAVLKWVMTAPLQPRVELAPSPTKKTPPPQQTATAPEQKATAPGQIATPPPPAAPTAAPTLKTPPPKVKKKPETVAAPPPTTVAPPQKQEITLEDDALRADLAKELSRLQKLKHDFEESYQRFTHPESAATAPATSPKKAKTAAPEAPEGEPLIEEIKTSKKKPKLPSPKVAEQGEIIDNFIKVAPTLPRTKPVEHPEDLAEDSVHYGDNIVSETLVDILLKQGKKDKAIDMLRKLIWKFPQKKAYFAAQIEALKG